MDLLIKGTVICVVATMLVSVLKRNTPELALLLILAVVGAVMAGTFSLYGELVLFWHEMIGQTGLDSALFSPLIKIMAISLVTRIGSDICQDSGQKTLSFLMELTGTLCSLGAATPLLKKVVSVLLKVG